MGLFYWFWDDILGLIIILPVFTMLGINAAALPMFVIVLIKLILTLVLLYLIQLVLRKAVNVLRGGGLRSDGLVDAADVRALQNAAGCNEFQQTLIAARDIDSTIAP